MTKDEIKTLIAEKISGQGNQVDIGGALADVLNGIVDSIPGANALEVNDAPGTYSTVEDFIEAVGASPEQICNAPAIELDGVIATKLVSNANDEFNFYAIFGVTSTDCGMQVVFRGSGGNMYFMTVDDV